MTLSLPGAARVLVAVGADLHRRGWLPATSGNLSVRLADGRVAITASGTDKGALRDEDILAVGADGALLAGAGRPSAETALHLGLYARRPDVGAIIHVHSPAATVLSMVVADAELVLSGYELQKALSGVTSHEARVALPVLDNDQDALALDARAAAAVPPDGHGYLIRGHGLYTWGADARRAARHAEALDFIFQCELQRRAVVRDWRDR